MEPMKNRRRLAQVPAADPFPVHDLPLEVLAHVLGFLSARDKLKVLPLVDKQFKQATKMKKAWHQVGTFGFAATHYEAELSLSVGTIILPVPSYNEPGPLLFWQDHLPKYEDLLARCPELVCIRIKGDVGLPVSLQLSVLRQVTRIGKDQRLKYMDIDMLGTNIPSFLHSFYQPLTQAICAYNQFREHKYKCKVSSVFVDLDQLLQPAEALAYYRNVLSISPVVCSQLNIGPHAQLAWQMANGNGLLELLYKSPITKLLVSCADEPVQVLSKLVNCLPPNQLQHLELWPRTWTVTWAEQIQQFFHSVARAQLSQVSMFTVFANSFALPDPDEEPEDHAILEVTMAQVQQVLSCALDRLPEVRWCFIHYMQLHQPPVQIADDHDVPVYYQFMEQCWALANRHNRPLQIDLRIHAISGGSNLTACLHAFRANHGPELEGVGGAEMQTEISQNGQCVKVHYKQAQLTFSVVSTAKTIAMVGAW